MTRFSTNHLRWIAICLTAIIVVTSPVTKAQSPDQQQQIAERFLEVLLRNPRPGTAFDRVYSYHLQNQSLDAFVQSLASESGVDRLGEKQLVLGLIELRRGNLDKALAALARAETSLPHSSVASYHLAKAWIAQGKRDRAIAALQRSVGRNPDRRDAPEIYLDLGKLLCGNGQTDAAVEVWQSLIDRFQSDTAIAEKVASALVAEQQYELALERYVELAEQAKTSESRIAFQISVAEMHDRLGQPQLARDQLQTILNRLRPGSWLFSDVRGRIEKSFLAVGDLEGLTRYYQQQAELTPDEPSALVRLAEILYGIGRTRDAETALRTVIMRSPIRTDARLALVEILADDGRAGEAAEHLEYLLGDDPANPDYLMRLGEIRLNDLSIDLESRRQAARDAWNRLAAARSEDAAILATVARRMHAMGQSERATELYRQAIASDPDAPQYREYLGEHLHRLGRVQEAVDAWKSIASGPRHNSAALVRVAEIFASAKIKELALQAWREAAIEDLTFEQRLRYANFLSESDDHAGALAQLGIASALVEEPENRESWLNAWIEAIKVAGKLPEEITQRSLEDPTAENQRVLALLFRANDQLEFASAAIAAAMKLAPDDVQVLNDAVDIFEVSRRNVEATRILETLARIDPRFQVNHLRRLVGIWEQLGELNKALEVSQALIDANPSAPESYRLLARIAFDAGQDQRGEAVLRRAIIVAPRETEPRVTLATRLADRFETTEAIELYWEAIELESRLIARTELIRQLVPLYARRGEIDQLVRRIERLELSAFDNKAKQILIAWVWTSAKDHQQAQQVLQQMLLKNPRDVDLLETMIESLAESGDVATAVTFQRRLVDVEGTPENQHRLTALELQAGLISPLEGMIREIEATEDPRRMVSIINRNASKDPEQSAELARVASEMHPQLWDIKIIRAQLLLLSDLPERAEHLALADRLAGEVAALELDPQAKAPSTGSTATNLQPSVSSQPLQMSTTLAITHSPFSLLFSRPGSSWQGNRSIAIVPTRFAATANSQFLLSTATTLHQTVNLNDRRVQSRIHNGTKSYSFPLGSVFIAPDNYFQAFWTARCVQILADCELAKLTGRTVSPLDVIAKRFSTPDPESEDVAGLRDAAQLQSIGYAIMGTEATIDPRIVWRIAELDPSGEHPHLADLLGARSEQRQQTADDATPAIVGPLDPDQLTILARLCQVQQRQAVSQSRSPNEILIGLHFRQSLIAEYRLANLNPPPEFLNPDSTRRTGFALVLAEIQAALNQGNLNQADELAGGLVKAARSSQVGEFVSPYPTDWITAPRSELEQQFILSHRDVLIDAWLAYCSRESVVNPFIMPTADLFGGQSLQFVVPVLTAVGKKPRFEILQLQTPLSKRLIDTAWLRGLLPLIPKHIADGSSRQSLSFTDDLLRRLSSPMDGAPRQEQKLRRVFAAFATWWDDRPYDCQLQLETLADEFPDDVDLQIEAARLAVVNLRSSQAFERLDQIKASDDATLDQVQLARIILAAQAGNDALVRSAAKDLLSRPIDPATSELLKKHLEKPAKSSSAVKSVTQSIAMQPQTSVPSRSPSIADVDRQIQLGKTFLESGDLITASEVAYSILNRLHDTSTSSHSRVRSQAIEILIKSGRIQPLITTMELKFKSSGHSEVFRQELADLYVASGKPEKASQLWEDVITAQQWSPRRIILQASALRGQRDFHHAAILYLCAFERDPELWESHWNVFADAASMSASQDILYSRLSKLDISSFSLYSLCTLIRMRGTADFTQPQCDFARHVIQHHPSAASHLDLLLEAIPSDQREHAPELFTMMTNAISHDDAFRKDSPLWAVRGWTDSGSVRGVLADIMNFLHRDAAAADSFLSAVEPAKSNAETKEDQATRELLKAIYQLDSPSTRDSAFEAIANLCPTSLDQDSGSLASHSMPSGLLWQIGQYLESIDPSQRSARLQIGIFQAAIRNASSGPLATSTTASPRDQLFRAYARVGHGRLARRGWLNQIQTYVYPRTTGVREDRQLQLAAHTAVNLLQIGFPIDAAGVCRKSLDDPLTFQLAQPYAHGQNHRRILMTLFQSAIDSIDAQTASAYLDEVRADIELDPATAAIDLLTTTNLGDASEGCLFETAVREAATTEPGRQRAAELLQTLKRMDGESSDQQSFLAARLILASVIEPERVVALLDELRQYISMLPTVDQETLQQYVHVLAAVRTGQLDSSDLALEQTIDVMRRAAIKAENTAITEAFTRLSRTPQAMHAVLDAIVPVTRSGPLQRDQSEDCLRVASHAARSGHWDVVARALELALSDGPPIVTQTSAANVADEYGGQVESVQIDTGVDPMTATREQVLSVLAYGTDRAGIPITSPRCNADQLNMDTAHRSVLNEALQRIMVPSETLLNVYAYKRSIVAGVQTGETLPALSTHSVSYAAGNIARASGMTIPLMQRMRQRSDANTGLELSAVLVDLAVTCDDDDALTQAVDRFASSVNDRLPLITSEPASGETDSPASRPIPPRDTLPILTLVDQVIGTLWPLMETPDLSPRTKEQVTSLLIRTTALMRNNQEVASQYDSIIIAIELKCQ